MDLGQKIKQVRKRAKLSQQDLGELCGYESAQGRVSHYENNRREPSLSDLRLIARHTGSSLEEMLVSVDESSHLHRLSAALNSIPQEYQDEFFGTVERLAKAYSR